MKLYNIISIQAQNTQLAAIQSFIVIIISMIFINFNRDLLPPVFKLAASEATQAEAPSLGSSSGGRGREPGPGNISPPGSRAHMKK